MQRRSERLLEHQPSFRHFDDHDADVDARQRDADRKRKSRDEYTAVDKHDEHLSNAIRNAAHRRERESSTERDARLQSERKRSAASREGLQQHHVPQSTTTDDAQRYAAQIENTCVFHVCCLCAYEGMTDLFDAI